MAWPVKANAGAPPKAGAAPFALKKGPKKKMPAPKAAQPMHKQIAAQMLDPDSGSGNY